ncbi:toxin co-regulated pilus biosynthesis Q family protein [Trinickia dinghuensis]|uniref:Toxin co-regulated pilus biosynthesis protein Q C-terminal domain-containing protein n=1 Tax=Trinickia dinghuensis TaxID=2291023 RepID=A0A3D8K0Y1_9BURK|nr:toxin co-regulated pilus biosynthesis Q family protein [Trinickia dinghuensis]RDU98742.1 hypothetical protein DWV00_10765 [Trinickia dinghuensis]
MKGCEMHKTRIVATLAVASIGLTCAATARAGFINEAPVEPPPATASASAAAPMPTPDVTVKPLDRTPPVSTGKKVTEIGFSPNDLYMPRGQGRNVALSDMLPVVVPHDYRVDTTNVDTTLPVTWSGGLPWDTVLTNALAPLSDVHVTFDWNAHTVALYRGAARDASPAPAAAFAPASSPASVAPPTESWIVSPSDSTLRHALAKWATQAGWQLVWDASVDVPVTVSATFDGDFRSAVKALFSSLSAADVNLSALMYTGNHVLRVTETGQRAQ